MLSEDLVDRLGRFGEVRRRLSACAGLDALLARTAELACEVLGADRAVVLSVHPGLLTAEASAAIAHPASDRLRRRVLAAPVALRADSFEADLVRRGAPTSPIRATSQLAVALDLEQFVLTPVTPGRRTLAMLVADREGAAISELDLALNTLLAEFLAATLEHTIVQARQELLAGEFERLSTSTLALMREVVEAPDILPGPGTRWPAVSLAGQLSAQPMAGHRLTELLTAGEAQVATLLVTGRSNREIADEIVLSPETVKATVARILRKLGASNRVEAAAIILRLGE